MADETPTKPADVKSGFKTTEFWIMLVVTLAGLLPMSGIFKTDSVALKICGLIVSLATAMGWTAMRTSLKKAAQVLVFVLVPLSVLGGCCTGTIKASEVDPLWGDVCNRHDKLVKGELDPKSISEADKATYLRSTQILRQILSEAQKK